MSCPGARAARRRGTPAPSAGGCDGARVWPRRAPPARGPLVRPLLLSRLLLRGLFSLTAGDSDGKEFFFGNSADAASAFACCMYSRVSERNKPIKKALLFIEVPFATPTTTWRAANGQTRPRPTDTSCPVRGNWLQTHALGHHHQGHATRIHPPLGLVAFPTKAPALRAAHPRPCHGRTQAEPRPRRPPRQERNDNRRRGRGTRAPEQDPSAPLCAHVHPLRNAMHAALTVATAKTAASRNRNDVKSANTDKCADERARAEALCARHATCARRQASTAADVAGCGIVHGATPAPKITRAGGRCVERKTRNRGQEKPLYGESRLHKSLHHPLRRTYTPTNASGVGGKSVSGTSRRPASGTAAGWPTSAAPAAAHLCVRHSKERATPGPCRQAQAATAAQGPCARSALELVPHLGPPATNRGPHGPCVPTSVPSPRLGEHVPSTKRNRPVTVACGSQKEPS